jgi:hypothetical protein
VKVSVQALEMVLEQEMVQGEEQECTLDTASL